MASSSITFDTGMLIALDRRKHRAWEILRNITRRGVIPVVPAVACVEFWRGRTDRRDEILSACHLEAMGRKLCVAAGEALGAVEGATLADAVVMASASLRGGGVVFTSDPDDLATLNEHFPSVLVVTV